MAVGYPAPAPRPEPCPATSARSTSPGPSDSAQGGHRARVTRLKASEESGLDRYAKQGPGEGPWPVQGLPDASPPQVGLGNPQHRVAGGRRQFCFLGGFARPLSENAAMRTIIEFLTFLHLKGM